MKELEALRKKEVERMEMERLIAIRPGLTVEEDICSWNNPRYGRVIFAGLDDEGRPFHLTLRLTEFQKITSFVEEWMKKAEERR